MQIFSPLCLFVLPYTDFPPEQTMGDRFQRKADSCAQKQLRCCQVKPQPFLSSISRLSSFDDSHPDISHSIQAHSIQALCETSHPLFSAQENPNHRLYRRPKQLSLVPSPGQLRPSRPAGSSPAELRFCRPLRPGRSPRPHRGRGAGQRSGKPHR